MRQSQANFEWLVENALEMFKERMFRWPDSSEHFTKTFIEWCAENSNKISMNKGKKLTPFAVTINPNSNCRKIQGFSKMSVTEQYQNYIKFDKPFADWTKRQKPSWH